MRWWTLGLCLVVFIAIVNGQDSGNSDLVSRKRIPLRLFRSKLNRNNNNDNTKSEDENKADDEKAAENEEEKVNEEGDESEKNKNGKKNRNQLN